MNSLALRFALAVSTTFAAVAFAADDPAAAPPAPPSPPAANGADANASAPKIHFDTPVYEFGKVACGQTIQHTFIVSNAGNATLVISSVHPSCGCTSAGAWTKEIQPNMTGTIPVQINSAYLRGPVVKTVTVTSNDKAQPSVTLRLQGTIWKPIEFNPSFAFLHVYPEAESNAATTIRISNKTDRPVVLSTPESANKFFAGTLKTVEEGKEFDLIVSAVPPLPSGSVQGSISIKTSEKDMPVLNIPITAISPQPAVLVTPPSIALAPAVTNRNVAQSIAIHATGPQPLILSDASVNAQGVDVQVKETVPGRSYNLTLTFPQGFQIPKGQELLLSVKSNHPQYPVIRVPITQLPAPAAVTAGKG